MDSKEYKDRLNGLLEAYLKASREYENFQRENMQARIEEVCGCKVELHTESEYSEFIEVRFPNEKPSSDPEAVCNRLIAYSELFPWFTITEKSDDA